MTLEQLIKELELIKELAKNPANDIEVKIWYPAGLKPLLYADFVGGIDSLRIVLCPDENT